MSPELRNYIDRKLTSAISRNVKLKNELISLTNFLDSETPVSERIFILMGGNKPICDNGNSYKWNNNLSKYVACGRTNKCKCAKQNQIRKLHKNIIFNYATTTNDIMLIKSGYMFLNEKKLYDFLCSFGNVDIIDPYTFIIKDCVIYFYSFSNIKDKNFCFDLKQKFKNHRCIIIFEDELVFKEHIVFNRLKYCLSKQHRLCGARQTNIKFIEATEAKEFLNQYHIQGYSNCKFKIGAYYNNELISVMTFGKTRHFMGRNNNDNSYELIRYSSKYNVPGIASKLLSFFKKNIKPLKIETYCDLRWGTGDVYRKMGFTELPSTTLGYWYIKNGIRYYRYNFCKQKLIKLGYDKNKSESKIMDELGYTKVYDAGNLKFEMK